MRGPLVQVPGSWVGRPDCRDQAGCPSSQDTTPQAASQLRVGLNANHDDVSYVFMPGELGGDSIGRFSHLHRMLACSPERPIVTRSSPQNDRSLSESAVTILTYLLVLLAVAFCWSRNDADPDLWGHIRFGADRLAAGLSTTTTYSYTAVDQSWVNHELFAESAFAVVERMMGSFGLLALKLVLGVIVAALWLTRHRRDRVSPLVSFGSTLLVAWGLAHFWTVRPQIFSFFLFAWVLVILGYAFSGWEGKLRWRWPRPSTGERNQVTSPYAYDSKHMRVLWLAPLLFAMWGNTHGAFVAGVGFYVCYLLGRIFEAWWLRGERAYGHMRRFGLMALAATFSTAIQPYGLKLHYWLWQSLRTPRPEITEWHPPELFAETGWPLLVVLLLFFAAAFGSRRPRDLVQWTLLSALAVQALTHSRHIPFFLLAWVFWIPPHLESLWKRIELIWRRERQPEVSSWNGAVVLALGSLCLAGALWPKLGPIRVERDKFPVGAVEFLLEHRWDGRIVVTYNWAQYVVAALGAREDGESGLQVAFDGRFRTAYPQREVDSHFDFILGNVPAIRHRGVDSPPFDPTRTLRTGFPDLVLISRGQPHAVSVMERQRGWLLLYQDSLAQIWGTRNRFGDPASPDYLPSNERVLGEASQEGAVAWPAIKAPTASDQGAAK